MVVLFLLLSAFLATMHSTTNYHWDSNNACRSATSCIIHGAERSRGNHVPPSFATSTNVDRVYPTNAKLPYRQTSLHTVYSPKAGCLLVGGNLSDLLAPGNCQDYVGANRQSGESGPVFPGWTATVHTRPCCPLCLLLYPPRLNHWLVSLTWSFGGLAFLWPKAFHQATRCRCRKRGLGVAREANTPREHKGRRGMRDVVFMCAWASSVRCSCRTEVFASGDVMRLHGTAASHSVNVQQWAVADIL